MTTFRPVPPDPRASGQNTATGRDDAPRPYDPDYSELLAQTRDLINQVAGSTPPHEILVGLAATVSAAARTLEPYRAPESQRWDGQRPELPGRGHPLLPEYVVDEFTAALMRGRVTFSRVHLGSNGAVHGGVTPLLFDDVLGRLVQKNHSGTARTAYLHVNYRRVVPFDVELGFRAVIGRVDGRKRFVQGSIHDLLGTVLADGEALFVELKPSPTQHPPPAPHA